MPANSRGCEVEIGNWDPEARQTTVTAEGLEHVRKMPMLKKLGIPYVPTLGRDLKALHGLKNLELLGLEDIFFDGPLDESAIHELQKTIPNLSVTVHDKDFPSLHRIAAGAVPRQQEIFRHEGAEGLKVIERFLAMMWAKRDAEAARLGDLDDLVADFRRLRREPGFEPFKVLVAYADSDNVLAITEPPVTYTVYGLDGHERRAIGKRTAHVVVRATRINGSWRVNGTHSVTSGSEEQLDWFRQFLSQYPGSPALRPSPTPTP